MHLFLQLHYLYVCQSVSVFILLIFTRILPATFCSRPSSYTNYKVSFHYAEIDGEKPTCVVLYMAMYLIIMYWKVAPSLFTVKIKTALSVAGMSAKETGDSIWLICSLQTLNHGRACCVKETQDWNTLNIFGAHFRHWGINFFVCIFIVLKKVSCVTVFCLYVCVEIQIFATNSNACNVWDCHGSEC